MTQLTLQLDDDLVLRAREYSTRTEKSLSDLVADFLASLTPERDGSAGETALLSEAALAQDWLRDLTVETLHEIDRIRSHRDSRAVERPVASYA